METMRLKHVRVCSNDHLYTKGHKMVGYMKLVGKWSSAQFLPKVDEDDNDVDVGLKG